MLEAGNLVAPPFGEDPRFIDIRPAAYWSRTDEFEDHREDAPCRSPELPRDRSRPQRVVHRHGLHRHRRHTVRAVPPVGRQRPLHAGCRTAWHTHPNGQTIYVTEGVGLCQRRGGEIEVIRPGDTVFFESGEDHWHGAAPNRFMTHIAMQEVDDQGSPVTWGQHVSDEEYGAAPAIDR